ncbi:prolyl oligopeptidase family serine peptidase [Paenibacillus sp. HJL G12]|uniref:Prolyl oligopeptidase family serine peptidase n=1 Tax=Paenibacillus dendrobii TaxID=2691084 RepID=A0A7X3INV2_9BACL|nr:prolyl oligopeptidase family serine peptidase [Paenibacillus dendrobii]MWV47373.1 prolyl oligopeptidase family serine peptidase [Paenibacillus dendrobii]
MSQQAYRLEKEITKKVSMDYLLHLPEGYDRDGDQTWPVILFLHGSGERGSNVELVKAHGVPHIVDQDPAFPFIVISPQCPDHSDWNAEKEAVMAALDEVMHTYQADPTRVYLTGLSMGGYGTWQLAAEHPGRFAAAVPVCGGGNPSRADTLKETPIWAFHGAKDDVVPLSESEVMTQAVQAVGGDVKLTIYPEADHNSWTETYDNQKVYDWLLEHSL